MARLLHPDAATVLEIVVRGERVIAHEVSATDPGLVTGCSSIPVTAASTELVELLVFTGYVAGKDAVEALDAISRELPPRTLSAAARRVVDVLLAVENEVECQRRDANRKGDEFDG